MPDCPQIGQKALIEGIEYTFDVSGVACKAMDVGSNSYFLRRSVSKSTMVHAEIFLEIGY